VVILTPRPFYRLVKILLYLLNRTLDVPLARSAPMGDRKCLSPLSGIELPLCDFATSGLVTMPIELFLLVLCSDVK
jgi:hypothetical protein